MFSSKDQATQTGRANRRQGTPLSHVVTLAKRAGWSPLAVKALVAGYKGKLTH